MSRKRRKRDKNYAFITCVNDKLQYRECVRHIDALKVPPGFSIEKISIDGAHNIAEAYDRAMRLSDAEFKVYLHQDTFIKNPNFLADTYRVFESDPTIGMMGVVGATRLPRTGVWFERNWWYCYGLLLECRRGGVLHSVLGKFNRRKERIIRFRKVRGLSMPVVVIDGLIMVTRQDISWRTDLYSGFVYYEGPHCIEFIKQGYRVVLPGQKRPWVMHYGPQVDRSTTQQERMTRSLAVNAEKFCKEYPEFIGRDVYSLLAQYALGGQ